MHTHSNQSNQRQRKCSINSNKLLWNAFLYRKHLRFFFFFFWWMRKDSVFGYPKSFQLADIYESWTREILLLG